MTQNQVLRMQPSQKPSFPLLGSLLTLAENGVPLGLNSLLLALAGGLGLRTLSVHLLLDCPLTGLLCLGTVDLGMKGQIVFSSTRIELKPQAC